MPDINSPNSLTCSRLASLTRREALRNAGAGFGLLALAGLIGQSAPKRAAAAATDRASAEALLAPKAPHFPVRAKRIIFLFMEGATSQVDTWEYKPKLQAADGKVGPGGGILTASKFQFARHGETGTWVSELYPQLAKKVDQVCFIRGLHTDTPAHPQAVVQLHTGAMNATLTRPSMGAWLLYGLGSENQDLPGYITINPSPNFGGTLNDGTAFLPAHFQGTRIDDTGRMPNLRARTAPSFSTRKRRATAIRRSISRFVSITCCLNACGNRRIRATIAHRSRRCATAILQASIGKMRSRSNGGQARCWPRFCSQGSTANRPWNI